jgi:hypothetical protein
VQSVFVSSLHSASARLTRALASMIALAPLVLASPAVLAASTPSPGSAPPLTSTPSPVSGNCGMQLGGKAAFCDTFDNKNPGIPSRTGDLDPNVWGVSRATGNTNFGQGEYNGWAAATQLQTCNGTITVSPPHDVMICNGQLREASNDNPSGAGGVTTLAMYPKQPFDFAGRTGTASFDISNDSHGTHAAWPEFWLTNLPVPTPFNHYDSWQSLPQHGFGIRFGAAVAPGQWGSCQNGNNLGKRRWTVDSAVIVRNYVMDDTNGLGGVRTNMAVHQLDCVVSPPDNSGITNHIELKISQNQIDVYATDAGVVPSPSTLRHIAVVTNANLSLTRGLIWLEDVHYNADKGDAPSQKQHTFVWDNVAFDGPFTYRDFSYDSLDGGQVNAASNTVDLGKFSLANQTASWNVLNMPANPQADAVRVLFNFDNQSVPTVLNVTVNGHKHPTPWPYPDKLTDTWRTFAVTIPITDLVPGTNVVQLGSDQAMVTSNVNIVLVDVPGGVPVLPGSNNAYPAGGNSGGGNPGGGNSGGGNSGGNTAPPTVAFSASPTSITSGKISIVTWSSTNATSCTAAGGWTGTKATSGTFAVSPISTATYTLTCTGTGGTSSVASTTVAVQAVAVNGACGSANGTTASSAPSTNLCSTGTPSSMAGSGPWTWSCGGSNGGTTASCFATGSASASSPPPTSPPPVSGNCGMQLGGPPAFCDTFNTAAGIGNRSGQLNGTVWGASRWTGDMNFGAASQSPWVPATLTGCSGSQVVKADADIIICNGQMREATNDNATGGFEAGTVIALTMYPKQPFNFAGRTGTISFDVSNDSQGTHAVWPELWITDTPKPSPFLHFSSSGGSIPANAFGIRFAASTVAGQGGQLASSCPSDNNIRWTVDSVVAVRNYVINDTFGFGTPTAMTLTPTGCVIASSGPNGGLNHVEVRVAQNQVDVYATDAGTTAPLVHIASIANANLTFAQGLVWIEDVHYNADKSGRTPSQHNHTFAWDNFAFDGPVLPRDTSVDVLDSLTACHDGTVCLGWQTNMTSASQPAAVTTLPITTAGIAAAQAQFLMFDAWFETQPKTFAITLNGHPYSFAWPFPYSSTFAMNSFMFAVNKADLVAGPNALTIASDQSMVVMNINVVLAGAGGQ